MSFPRCLEYIKNSIKMFVFIEKTEMDEIIYSANQCLGIIGNRNFIPNTNIKTPPTGISSISVVGTIPQPGREILSASYNELTNGINIDIPSNENRKSLENKLSGIIAHEYVHYKQYKINKRIYNSDKQTSNTLTKEFPNIEDITPMIWIKKYYALPTEFEAHAWHVFTECYIKNNKNAPNLRSIMKNLKYSISYSRIKDRTNCLLLRFVILIRVLFISIKYKNSI